MVSGSFQGDDELSFLFLVVTVELARSADGHDAASPGVGNQRDNWSCLDLAAHLRAGVWPTGLFWVSSG